MKFSKKNILKGQHKIIISVGVAFVVGMVIQRIFFSPSFGQDNVNHESVAIQRNKQTLWTCSMHPQIKLPKPGKCPICFMDLIPLETNGNTDERERAVSISDYAKKLLRIETFGVTRKFIDAQVRMVGKVDYDETKISYISAWMPGRLDRLYVNYTGIAVKKGEHMADIYSPDLLSAQEELIQALRTVKELGNSQSSIVQRTAKTTVDAAREKLRLLGLTAEQITKIEQQGQTRDHITLYATRSGVVIHKNVQEGMYVQTGTRIYTIADLSSVWVQLDAYESDLQWLRYGEQVEFSTETYPGKVFTGTISFIDPIIDSATRTANVRVIVSNESLALKPGMFVRGIVHAKVASNGQIMNLKLAGKWISPMHPEIIKDEPGICDICGMPLVSAESLGYVDKQKNNAPLVIPVSAALKTGKRAVVYVEIPNQDKPTYEGHEVVLGPRLGNYYIVEDGLVEGQRVVTHGAFSLDAELQIQAKPSMMSPDNNPTVLHTRESLSEENTISERFSVPAEFSSQFGHVLDAYFTLQKALALDDGQQAKIRAGSVKENLAQVDMSLLKGRAHMAWMKYVQEFEGSLDNLIAGISIEEQRKYFAVLSNQLILAVKLFAPSQQIIYKTSCPMAFDETGASWLQDTDKINNPYLGKAMPKCGVVDAKIRFSAMVKGEGNE